MQDITQNCENEFVLMCFALKSASLEHLVRRTEKDSSALTTRKSSLNSINLRLRKNSH